MEHIYTKTGSKMPSATNDVHKAKDKPAKIKTSVCDKKKISISACTHTHTHTHTDTDTDTDTHIHTQQIMYIYIFMKLCSRLVCPFLV